MTNTQHDPLLEQEELKQKILKTHEEKNYSSDSFIKIKQKVYDDLERQATDDALRDISIWALVLGSSDVHYEVYEFDVKVRFRIDGILVDIFTLSHGQYKKVTERLKYSASLKLNITNVPQDGKYSFYNDENAKIDVRVSTLPVKYGESIVCRILDSSGNIIHFEDLWFYWTSKRMIEKSLEKKQGMILVTWPTGSWKTTTLYTMLHRLNTRDKKIITLEDPIEYELSWIVQSEIDEKHGVTFVSGLKACLRQDPDIIMLGEIRDFETLQTATQAALTWHLVLSTLHTKSAADTLDRIINMWLPPYILSSALDTIIAQRLVRKICPKCKQEKQKSPEEIAIIEAMMEETGMSKMGAKNIKLYEWAGCKYCKNSWFKGRLGMYEIINLNEALRSLIRSWASVWEILTEARSGDLIKMQEDGILKALKWYTSIEEILRVI